MQNRVLSFRRPLLVVSAFFCATFLFFQNSSPVLLGQTATATTVENIEQSAPLLDEAGVVLVHLNLRKLDPQAEADRLTVNLDTWLPMIGFDTKSCRGILKEWKTLLPEKLPLLTEPLDRLTKQAGIQDIYWVGPIRKEAKDSLPFFAVPVKDKTDEQKAIVRSMARDILQWALSSEDEPVFFERGDMLILPVAKQPAMPTEEDAETVRENLESIKSISRSLLAEALRRHEGDLIRGLFVPPQNVDEILAKMADDEDLMAEPTKNFAETSVKNIRWISFGFDLAEPKARYFIQVRDEAAAKLWLTRLKDFTEYLSEKIEQKSNENELFQYFSSLMSVSFAETARQLMPEQDDDCLRGTIDQSNFLLYHSLVGCLSVLGLDE